MSDNPRLFLACMSNGGALEEIKEKVEPILQYLDGIVWVIHNTDKTDPGAAYLESIKGAGKIIYRDFVYRHAYSMNETLFCGKIEEGDLVMWSELLEHPPACFVSQVKTQVNRMMFENGVDCLYYFGKPYVFRYNERMEYTGVLHYGFQGYNKAIEMSQHWPDESVVRVNTRPKKRTDSYHFVFHYLFYYVSYPAGGNQCLLGLEKNGDPARLFPARDARRLEFRREMKKRELPLSVDGVKTLLEKPLDEIMKRYFNDEKILNDTYRYHILGDRSFKDNHDFKDMISIP